MQTIQNLIAQLPEEPTREALLEIVEQFCSQETIWAAYSPSTRNYYLGLENGHRAAYVFTEKQYYDQFEEFMKGQGVQVVCSSNQLVHREALFLDLYRSGFDMLILDNNFHPYAIMLEDAAGDKIHDFQSKQPVLNPELVLRMNFFFQNMHLKKATSNMQLDMFHSVQCGRYLLPVDISEMEHIETNQETGEMKASGGSFHIPMLQTKDNKKFAVLFTDIYEMRRYDKDKKFSAQIIGFEEAREFVEKLDGFVINPMGCNLILDTALLQSVSANAKTPIPKKPERRMSTAPSRVYFDTPDVDAVEEMLDVLCDALPSYQEVNAVYIRQAHRSNDMRPHYLFVVDSQGEQDEIFRHIAELAIPYANGFNLEFTNYANDFGKQAVGTCNAFYRKKSQ